MRGAYTAGVLDAFLDGGIDIRSVIGVSAGANAGANYVASQRERNQPVFVELASDRHFAGVANLLRERSWFGMRYLFETVPERLVPFDYGAFARSPRVFTVCVTEGVSGVPLYLRQHDYDPRWFVRTVLRASSSLPLLAPPVAIDGRWCFDGGVSDAIPIERSIADGNLRNVVVLTRNAGYRKQPQRLGPPARRLLRRHPGVVQALAERHGRYNACLERVEALERAGAAFVLRPVEPLLVDRMERDVVKLEALYRQGYEETLARAPALKAWCAG